MNRSSVEALRNELGRIITDIREACSGTGPIVIYGCGYVVPKLIRFVKSCGGGDRIKAILDDSPAKWDVVIDGIASRPPKPEDLTSAEAVIFAFPPGDDVFAKLGIERDAVAVVEGYMLDYALAVCEHKLTRVNWVTTSACNSRCVFCAYWNSDVVHLDADLIIETVNALPETTHTLSGGEFFCHPQWRSILSRIRNKDNMLLFTNGLLPDRAFQACDEYGITRFAASLDGGPETYRRVRGVDGFDKVMTTLRGLKQRPGTIVNVTFVITPDKTAQDFKTVEQICGELGLYFAVARYHQTDPRLPEAAWNDEELHRFDELIRNSPVISELDRHVHGIYADGFRRRLKLTCTAGFTTPYVDQYADLYWCGQKKLPAFRIGNLADAPITDLVRSERFYEIARKLHHCNDCWCATNRRFDLYLHQARNRQDRCPAAAVD